MALVPTYEHGDAAPEDVEPGSLLLDQAPTPSPEGVTWVLLLSSVFPFPISFRSALLILPNCKPKVQNAGDWTFSPLNHFKQNKPRSKKCNISYALPETAASVLVAAVAVGAAATILRRTTKAQETVDSPSKLCEDCGGSGICAECNGEGFVLKKLTEESAVKARMAAKNMATRYTAGLPKKWSYCSKCSSARSCSACGGRGRVSD
ncbi:Chaperone DnaJ [Cinnamomum micranthum f. kanehirae]|uniref:Chaperone DnaJ n=1 Tax=Cinnamomum micranthum f. kanehirae TaxID=337451 RepID=A0A443NLJ5_9MAGN|nr:Chaperone DnaJ [Cinnamomum micranthum f. kanehirae]